MAMDHVCCANDSERRSMTGGTEWTYWRPTEEGIVELGTLHGSRVGLPIHFHDENQLTFVLSGRRRFVIRGELIDLLPGQGTFIRAGIPHFSLPEPSGVVCFNAYLPVGGYAAETMIGEIRRLWHKAGLIRWPELAEVIRGHRAEMPTARIDRAASLPTDSSEPVSQIAARMGMSREGFSRMFARRAGMPPHAFRLMSRLNQARTLLRAGEAIACVAAETGFADQSHLGRRFRQAFGTTPGRYRAG
jgi:AraC-like DNA-binding protein